MSEGIRPVQSEEQLRKETAATEIIQSARSLNELFSHVRQLAEYEKVGNDAAEDFGGMSTFFASELAKIAAVIDSINGHSKFPGDPNTLEEVAAMFPNTALGVISDRCGMRAQVGQFLTELLASKQYGQGGSPDIIVT